MKKMYDEEYEDSYDKLFNTKLDKKIMKWLIIGLNIVYCLLLLESIKKKDMSEFIMGIMSIAFTPLFVYITKKMLVPYDYVNDTLKNFLKNWDKKYLKVNFDSNENKSDIMWYFSIFLNYDIRLSLGNAITCFFETGCFDYFEKYRVNKKDVYFGYSKRSIPKNKTEHLDIIMIAKKIENKGRLHLDAFENIKHDPLYATSSNYTVLDKTEKAVKYDKKHYEYIKTFFKDNTFLENIEKNSTKESIEPINLEPFYIDRLNKIYEENKVRFQIAIKDNYCRINIFIRTYEFEELTNLSELEKTIEETIKFVDELFD